MKSPVTRFCLMKHSFFSFRLGSMYHYNLKDFDYKSLVSFAEGWFKNVKAEKVPVEPSPL